MPATSYTDDQYFGSGRPWVDPRATQFAGGAKGDGTTSDSAAFAAAQAHLNSINGGVMYVPPGRYNLRDGGLDVNSTFSGVIGAGENSVLDCGGANVTPLTLSGFRSFARNLQVIGPTLNATVPTVHVTSNAIEADLRNLEASGGASALVTEAPVEVHSCKFLNCYGIAIWRTTNGVYGVRNQLDQSMPIGFPAPGTTPVPRQNNQSYSTGAIVYDQNFILQATTSGTTGSGSPTLQPYGVPITDGSITWGLVAPLTFYGILFDGNAQPNYIDDTDITGFYWASIALRNYAGGADPSQTFIKNTICAQAWVAGIWAYDGAGLTVQGGQIVNNGQHGLVTQGNWKGDTSISGALMYGNQFGASFSAGRNHMVENCQIYGANQAAVFGSSVDGLIVNGNNLGSSDTWGANVNPVLLTGTTDGCVITNNKFRGSSVGAVNDQSSGTHKVVANNL